MSKHALRHQQAKIPKMENQTQQHKSHTKSRKTPNNRIIIRVSLKDFNKKKT